MESKLKIDKLKIKSTTPEMTLDHNVTVLPTLSILEIGSHKYSMTYDIFNFNQAFEISWIKMSVLLNPLTPCESKSYFKYFII